MTNLGKKCIWIYFLGELRSQIRSAESSSSATHLPLVHQHLTASQWSAPGSNNGSAHASNSGFQPLPAPSGGAQQHPTQQPTATTAALFANQPQMAALAAAAAAAGHYSLWPSYRAAAAAAAVAAIDSTNQNSYYDSATQPATGSLDPAPGVQQSFLYPYHLAAVMASSQMAIFQQRMQQQSTSGSQLSLTTSPSGKFFV